MASRGVREATSARLRVLRSGSSISEKLAAALEADRHSGTVLKALEATTQQQKANAKLRKEKFAWSQQHQKLKEEERQIMKEWEAWMEANGDVELTMGNAGEVGRAEEELSGDPDDPFPELLCVAHACKLHSQLEYDLAFLRKQLMTLVTSVNSTATQLLAVGTPSHEDLNQAAAIVNNAQIQMSNMSLPLDSEEQVLDEELGALKKAIMDSSIGSTQAISVKRAGKHAGNAIALQAENEVQQAISTLRDDRVDLSLQLEWFERLLALRKTLLDDTDRMDQEFAFEVASLGVGDWEDPLGGWSLNLHKAYQQVFLPTDDLFGSVTTKSTNEKIQSLVNLAASVNPHAALSRQDVVMHHRFVAARKNFIDRRNARRAQYQREFAKAVEDTQAAFAQALLQAANLQRVERERRAHEQMREEAHRRLYAARRQKEMEDAITCEIARDLREAEEAVEMAKRERAAAQAVATKAALRAYKAEQEEIQNKMAALKAEREEMQRAEQCDLRRARSARVAVRRDMAADKERAKQRLIAQEAELEKLREESLQRLLKSVPYREKLEEIAAAGDLGRLQGHTAASATASQLSKAYYDFLQSARTGTAVESHGDADIVLAAYKAADSGGGEAPALLALAAERLKSQGQFTRAGYADKAITSDARWRFAAAAGDAKIGHTAYARDTLASLSAGARGSVAARMHFGSTSLAWDTG